MEKKVLNVGGNSKDIPIPEFYSGWTHHLLDIDPTGNPDIVCDARNLEQIAAGGYDSIYCSHNLEHYYSHDVLKVLRGFHHILKDDGFIYVKVPDLMAVMKRVIDENLDIEDTLYHAPVGAIAVKDVIYGWGKQIEQSGCDFFAHKTGFSAKSLLGVIRQCGFPITYYALGNLEIKVFALKQNPTKEIETLLNLPVE
jgi:hypothetical protein